VVEAAIDDLELRGYSLATQGEVRGLQLGGGASTMLSWLPMPPASVSYDMVRGDLGALSGGAGGVSLGALTCLANDLVGTSFGPDAALPPASTGWFYLVRFRLGLSVGDYGKGSAGGLRSGTGGCP
jgi:hypothetical protein